MILFDALCEQTTVCLALVAVLGVFLVFSPIGSCLNRE